MTAIWPPSLIQFPLRAGFGDSAPDLLLRSQNDAGPAKVRRRYTAGERPVVCTVLLRTQAERDLLDAWFVGALASGALPFQWPQLGAALGERNLLGTGDFSDLQIGAWTGSGLTVQPSAEPWGGYLRALQRDNSENVLWPVVAGQRLFVRARMRTLGISHSAALGIAFSGATGGVFQFDFSASLAAGSGWTVVSASAVAPAGAAFGRGYLLINGPAGENIGPADFAELRVSTVPLDRRYRIVSPPEYTRTGAQASTANLQLSRQP